MYINLTLAIPSKMYVNEFPPVNSARNQARGENKVEYTI